MTGGRPNWDPIGALWFRGVTSLLGSLTPQWGFGKSLVVVVIFAILHESL
jgi:hypothetical protein